MECLLTLEEMAARLRVSKKTLYKWSHLGTIPVARAGRLLRFNEADVMTWLKRKDDQRNRPAAEIGSQKRSGRVPMSVHRNAADVNSIVKNSIREVLD
ncbi:MAG: helix-turn-helix domain-containing protein [Nitrospirota bacterium]|nr:helix-turn-helix domain-containing protein [Nitrospirota bacterium]